MCPYACRPISLEKEFLYYEYTTSILFSVTSLTRAGTPRCSDLYDSTALTDSHAGRARAGGGGGGQRQGAPATPGARPPASATVGGNSNIGVGGHKGDSDHIRYIYSGTSMIQLDGKSSLDIAKLFVTVGVAIADPLAKD